MVKRGFTIGRFITRPRTQAGLVNMNHQLLQLIEAKNFFSIFSKSNGSVLIHCVDEGKTIDHNYYIENYLRSIVKEIWKQRRSAGMRLVENNARVHIHSDVVN